MDGVCFTHGRWRSLAGLAGQFLICVLAGLALLVLPSAAQEPELRALIVDGQNNHGNWPETSQMMKAYLEQTELFHVDIATTAPEGKDENFSPAWHEYDVVVSNYNGTRWPEKTEMAFEKFVRGGGGFVSVHAADNAFPDWAAYNEMIGVGGWGGRNQQSGPWIYYDDEAEQVVRDDGEGRGGSHGRQHPFRIVIRDDAHPVTQGMPASWMHANDELYDRLRGPANHIQLLATAYSDPATGGSGRHEPMLMAVAYGEGRVFHLPLGHGNDSQECVGFIVTLQRAAEWAASGEVTQPIPDDFPQGDATSSRPFSASSKGGR